MEARWWDSAPASVVAMTISRSATMPLVVNHLWPLMTHSSPSSLAVVDREVGSEPAFSGSVIEKPDRILPSSSG